VSPWLARHALFNKADNNKKFSFAPLCVLRGKEFALFRQGLDELDPTAQPTIPACPGYEIAPII